jgi:hypothetical protein
MISHPVAVCGDSISMFSTAIALSKGMTAYVEEAHVVGGGTKRGGSRSISTSVLCVVTEYLCTNSISS